MNGNRLLVSLATVLVLVGLVFVWSGERTAGEATDDGSVRQSAAGEREGTAEEDENRRERAAEEDENAEAALEFEGDRGTGFSGACVVDGEERTFEGEVPERMEFSPDGGRLECEIQKEGSGDLELTFTAGDNTRSVQRIDAPQSKVEILYEDGSLSTSTLSSGGARSSSQQTIVSGSSQSIVSSSQVTGSSSSTGSK